MLSWDQNPVARMRQERAWVEVNRMALAHNVRQVKGLLSASTNLMAVVKADAYGHGAVMVAQTALESGASWLGVATIPEGIELRQAGIEAPILILGATYTEEQIRTIARWNLQPTLCTPKQALIFSETMTSLGAVLPVHLKLDTGMSRLGTAWQSAPEFVRLVRSLPNLRIDSLYSHLATADSTDPTVMHQQQQRFETAVQACQAILQQEGPAPATGSTRLAPTRYAPRLHLANSAATLADASLHYDLVRVGIALYGLYPAEHLKARVALQPVLQVKARITQVKTIAAGTGVSYGHQFVAPREMQLAVVGIGYADGVPRNLSNRMQVLVRGQRVPQLGAVTMDQIMIDVSTVPEVQEGEVVTLLGQDGQQSISAEEWATTLGTIAWEILCGFKHRLPRVAVEMPISSRLPH